MSNQEVKTIQISYQEAQILLQLLDLSVKNIGISDGGNVAQNATYFFKKVTEAFQENKEDKKEAKVSKGKN